MQRLSSRAGSDSDQMTCGSPSVADRSDGCHRAVQAASKASAEQSSMSDGNPSVAFPGDRIDTVRNRGAVAGSSPKANLAEFRAFR